MLNIKQAVLLHDYLLLY